MSNRWLVSDTHWGHANIIRYTDRPYKSVGEMDESLIKNWNSVVQPEDIIYHLGDFAMSAYVVPRILPRLNGKEIHLIMGNHDRCWKGQERWNNFYLESGFTSIQKELTIQIGKYEVLLTHLPPVDPLATDQRYNANRPTVFPDYHLHGHRHSSPDKRLQGISLDVGIDGQGEYRPWRESEILAIIDNYYV